MARPRKTPDAETAVTKAVNDVGRALANLQQVFEDNGAQLTPAQHQKVFGFLNVTIAGVEQKTRLSLSTTILTSGNFSLDLDVPDAPAKPVLPATPHEAGRTLHMPQIAIAAAPVRGPRVFGEPPLKPHPALVAQQAQVKPVPSEIADKDEEGIGFMDN